ncbi:helix-turn-helix domain-containing protein [Methylobacterium sp. J-088]|uniref:helix-turn-helix domain-containing protein n=1 Tax=Methylobacterium sp. J-088 TaxID=2836664 RepID=UPI001FB9BB5E|nr:helix-turn-helix domain-containing protein [Methylobacterium sp. J-088]MCJ2063692.1 helix-turn-helix domain-containing protein [Methylobacterium sp. J-088]
MTYAEEIRRQVEAAPRAALPAVTAALWRAYGEGQVTEVEAEALSGLIEARQTKSATLAGLPLTDTSQDRQSSPRRPGVGSRPRTGASMERRRRWASSGRLPPAIAARFTLAEQGVLALVAAEVARRKDCRLAVGHLAAIVGVAETTVRNAIREAMKLGLVTVEERRVTGFRNDTNIVRIVSAEWTAWLRLARKPVRYQGNPDTLQQGGGCKSPQGTHTQVLDLEKSRLADPKTGCRGAAGDPGRSDPMRILVGGKTPSAMR